MIVVTNQSGIARGYYIEKDMKKLHIYINELLREYGEHIDAFYFCPHHPDIKGECSCRKSKTGLIEQAIIDFDIDVKKSVLFGDKALDLECGRLCNIDSYYISKMQDFW